MKNVDTSIEEIPSEKIKLDDELFTKIMAITIDNANEEKIFKAGEYRVNSTLLNDKFTVNVNIVVPDSLDDGGMRLVKYIISRAGVVENIVNQQSIKCLEGAGYRVAIKALKTILKEIKI